MTISRRNFMIFSAFVMGAAAASRSAFAAAGRDPDVIVIGAGLSGLGTSLALEEAGLRVRMIEGRERVGGRLFTLDDVPGHPEAGGNSDALRDAAPCGDRSAAAAGAERGDPHARLCADYAGAYRSETKVLGE